MKKHPRARRLQVVLELTERDEQNALQQWGELQQRLAQEQEQKQQLEAYTGEYQQKISTPSTTAMSAGHIHNALGFIGQIERAIKSQNQQIALLQQKAAGAQKIYLTLHGKVKALQELIERLEKEAAADADKEQQKQADEWSNRMAFRSRQSRR